MNNVRLKRITADRLNEIKRLYAEARNEPPGNRPLYGDTSGRFYLASGRRIVQNMEHAGTSQENQDTLFVELRMACNEVEILQTATGCIPELTEEIKLLQDERDAALADIALLRSTAATGAARIRDVSAPCPSCGALPGELCAGATECRSAAPARTSEREPPALSAEPLYAHQASTVARVKELEEALKEALDHLVMAVDISRAERVLDTYEANVEMCWIAEKRELLTDPAKTAAPDVSKRASSAEDTP